MSRKCAGCKKWLAAGQYTCPFCKRGEADLRTDLKEVNLARLRAVMQGSESLDAQQMVLLLTPFGVGELPVSFCGEVAAFGESALLLEAVVKKGGCTTVSSAHLRQLLDKIAAKGCIALEKEAVLQKQESDLRKRLLGGRGEEVSELEKESLSKVRKEIEQLRSLAFLELVLRICKVEECATLDEAKTMLVAATKKAAAEPVVMATPSHAKETVESTKAKVGQNEDVYALSRRNLESSQDEVDEWTSDEANDSPVLECDISVSDTEISIVGPLCKMLKEVVVTYGDEKLVLSKTGGMFFCKFRVVPDWSKPIELGFVMFLFKKLAFQPYAWKTFNLFVVLARPRRRIAVPVPFSKLVNLVIIFFSSCENWDFLLFSFLFFH